MKKAFIIYVNNPWGESQKIAYEKIAVKNGISIVDSLKPDAYDANDWSAIIPRIKSRGADLLVLLVNKSDMDLILRRAKEQNLNIKYYVSIHGLDGYTESSQKENYEGVCFTYPLAQLGASMDFVKKYKEEYGSPPLIYADTSYDALHILVQGIKESRKTNVPLKEVLEKTTYQGLSTKYEYGSDRSFSLAKSSLVCVQDKQLKIG